MRSFRAATRSVGGSFRLFLPCELRAVDLQQPLLLQMACGAGDHLLVWLRRFASDPGGAFFGPLPALRCVVLLDICRFRCDIQIFKAMEEVTDNIYGIFIELQTIAPAMDRVVELLNMPTDLHERRAMQRLGFGSSMSGEFRDHLRSATAFLREKVVKQRADDASRCPFSV